MLKSSILAKPLHLQIAKAWRRTTSTLPS